MGWYSELVLPRIVHRALGKSPFAEQRPRCVAAATGRVLEIGFGSGLNLPHYGPHVSEVLAIEPSRLALRLAEPQLGASPLAVRVLGSDAQALPLEDASVDSVVTTWTLCTLPDLDRCLGEIRRVLRPGGRLYFVEHGRSPVAGVARWQDRLDPLHRRLTGGCHINRAISSRVAASGLELERSEEFDLPLGPLLGHHYLGTAKRV